MKDVSRVVSSAEAMYVSSAKAGRRGRYRHPDKLLPHSPVLLLALLSNSPFLIAQEERFFVCMCVLQSPFSAKGELINSSILISSRSPALDLEEKKKL